jgi:hypothetical protein
MLMRTKITLKDDTVLYGHVNGFQGDEILSLLVTTEDGREITGADKHQDIKLSQCKKISMTNIERPKC